MAQYINGSHQEVNPFKLHNFICQLHLSAVGKKNTVEASVGETNKACLTELVVRSGFHESNTRGIFARCLAHSVASRPNSLLPCGSAGLRQPQNTFERELPAWGVVRGLRVCDSTNRNRRLLLPDSQASYQCPAEVQGKRELGRNATVRKD